MRELSPESIRLLAQELAGHLHGGVPSAQHEADHRWILERRRSEEEWARLRRKVVTSAAIWAIPLILGFIAVASWEKLVRAIVGAGQ